MNATDNGQCFVEKICKGCGHTFIVPRTNLWSYKQLYHGRYLFFCSWHCLNHNRAKKVDGRKKSANRLPAASLQNIRYYFGYTQNEIAVYLGVGHSCYQQYEQMHLRMSLENLKKLAAGFGCTVDDLTAEEFDTAKAKTWNCTIPHEK